ncbi:MAG: LPS assembly protein LptD [Acidobacteriia bacterium]|nr:LPS assembly protein LptD [Terriglobia bacterium]
MVPPRPDAPAQGEYNITAKDQTRDGPWYHLRGNAIIDTPDMQIKADELDYNEETGDLEARGHVHFEHFARGEKVDCERVEYNTEQQTGKFYDVSGSAPPQIQARPGMLTTQNPFYFQGHWAERVEDHYVLYDGFLTDCTVPRPWWRLKGPRFDVIPGDHAIAHHAWFYLKGFPLFYTPWFYKSLKKEPRRSGFLIPNIGNSSLHGKMFGVGYYWAINRSYDLTYRALAYTQAGFAHNAEMRGKVNQKTDFDLTVFGIKSTQEEISPSGVQVNFLAKSDLGNGWDARVNIDYLSSFAFLQQFTTSFNEAVFSETHSVGYVTKHWADFGVAFVAQSNVNFESTTPGDKVEIRKLPSVEFTQREHQLEFLKMPIWVGFDSSAGLLDRSEPGFSTAQFVDRLDVAPHVTTAFRWHDIQLTPTFGVRETEYSQSVANGFVSGQDILRSSRDLTAELSLPGLERIFNAPKWMGEKVKHVIEPRITYKYVTGIGDQYNNVIRFDEMDLLTNTNQIEYSLTNRLLAKDKNGNVTDFLTWELRWDRYFDPTFGGAIPYCGGTGQPGCQRNVIASELALTGFEFLDRPRTYSPVVSVVRVQSKVNVEWRTDYDPLTHNVSNSSVSVDGRVRKYFFGIGHALIRTDPVLLPPADQVSFMFGYGNLNSKGWNYRFDMHYDYRASMFQYWQAYVTYNTDCCGISVQYRRFSLGVRDDSQIQVAFAISNVGTFGTLKKQDRVF